MRIAIVSPTFPPEFCGVGDYTYHLSKELAKKHDLALWTGQASPENIGFKQVTSKARPWRLFKLLEIYHEIRNWGADSVIIEFTPHQFGNKPFIVNMGLPLFIFLLRMRLKSVVLTVHEAYYPLEFSIYGFLIGLPQYIQFQMLAVLSGQLVFATEPFFERYRRRLFWKRKRVHWLAVGSAIPLESSHVAKGQNLILLSFGSAHPGKLIGHILHAYDKVRQKLGSGAVELVFVGMKEEVVFAEIRRLGLDRLKDGIKPLGYLSASEVSAWLQKSSVVLVPYLDGISTRRTSAIAAFQHGRPVVTTRGHATGTMEWEKFCRISDFEDKDKFAEHVAELIANGKEAEELGREAQLAFSRYFAWPVISQKLEKILNL